MRTRLTLHPGKDGAKQLRDRYGDRLVCVRYRYDEIRKRRWKTVELMVEDRAWDPTSSQWPAATLVALQIAGQEREVRQRVTAAGGKWNPRAVVWELPSGQVVALGLVERIVSTVEKKEGKPHLQRDGHGQADPSTHR